MPTMEDVATSVTAFAGLLSAVAGLITALRHDRTVEPTEPQPTRRRRADGTARPARPIVGGNWVSASYGALALIMAAALVFLVGRSGSPLDQGLLISLRLAVGIPFALAAYFGVSDLYNALKHGERDLLISAGAGLTAAASALTAMLIAGTYQSTGSYWAFRRGLGRDGMSGLHWTMLNGTTAPGNVLPPFEVPSSGFTRAAGSATTASAGLTGRVANPNAARLAVRECTTIVFS